jgi:hypothetical protein
VRRSLLLVAAVLLISACDSPAADPEPEQTSSSATTSSSTTTTTIDPALACREVAEELATLLSDVLEELDVLDARTFSDRALWPEDLLLLETAGVELDRKAAELGCDPGTLQAAALAAVAGEEPESLLSRWLMELLLGR